jgi:alanine racemase
LAEADTCRRERAGLNASLGAVAHVDAGALAHNLAQVRALAPRSRVLAVIKADAYGHGLLFAARALHEADGFAVARLSEAERLRAAGIAQRIVLLPGVDTRDDLGFAARLALDLVVHHRSQIELLEQAPPGCRVDTWLEVDSGMHRLGIAPRDVAAAHRRLSRCAAVRAPLRVMTHLAEADAVDGTATPRQIEAFRACTANLGAPASIGNSAGIMAWPDARSEWVRPGIMLYGVSPFPADTAAAHGLRAVMTLTTRLFAVNRVPAGGAVGYGGTWTAPEDMWVGAAAAGYADGYPRHVPGATPMLVDGVCAPLIGRVSMDSVSVDLRGHPGARVGAAVTLWGRGLPVELIARAAGTIGYELVCRVSSRVPRAPRSDASTRSS